MKRRKQALLLTGISVIGVIATALLCRNDTLKYENLPEEEKTNGEMVKAYIPTMLSAGGTIACIVINHRHSEKLIAELLATIAVANKTYQTYRKEVIKEIGPEKEQEIYEVARENWHTYPFLPGEYDELDEEQIYYDAFTGRTFACKPLRLTKALYHLNRNLQLQGCVMLNDLYSFIGIAPYTDKNLGWLSDSFFNEGMEPWIDFIISENNGRYILDYLFEPEETTAETEFYI